jgi:hypothetical protein
MDMPTPAPTKYGTLQITSTPVLGTVYVDSHLWGIAPQTKQVVVGLHTILWGFYSTDYVKPADQTVEVKEGQTTSVTGTYAPNQRAPAPAMAPAGAATITVSADRASYSPGQVLKVSGTVSPITPGQDVAIMVNGPSGDMRAIDQITPNPDGTYSKNVMTFALGNPLGTWNVKATYQAATAITKFSF